MKTNELERKLIEAGCWFVKHGKRHDHWFSPITSRRFIIGRHESKEIPKGTLKAISEQSGVVL
ncbi:MAG: type II toxin-antitoxin system HicA family toxin [Bacteroidales bacterium]|nr:type II toxin-antitoxin system HicA family toxin [Bacteroidales bacterium]